ncbi:hypothetical protein OHS58_36535 [Amycolatopsis sp. NBC_00348]|uniref:hypothetical protein n=1 Tax=Amycolatopsis sp. NBC_00348 TaxID=2975956 RepID=UPI002E25ECAE
MSVLAWLFIGIVVAGVTACGLLWFLGWPHLPNDAVFDVTQVLDLLKIALSVVAGFGGGRAAGRQLPQAAGDRERARSRRREGRARDYADVLCGSRTPARLVEPPQRRVAQRHQIPERCVRRSAQQRLDH